MAKEKKKKRELHFTWDEAGGAHIRHDERLTLADAQEALGGLACIVAHNLLVSEGPEAVEALIERFRDGVWAYLETAEQSGVGLLPNAETPADSQSRS